MTFFLFWFSSNRRRRRRRNQIDGFHGVVQTFSVVVLWWAVDVQIDRCDCLTMT